ncbi:MAG: aminotransferase class III-fold pyridoxal phosphate-dependent enzyme, partial [Candidatus Thorarchaeota archaeon]
MTGESYLSKITEQYNQRTKQSKKLYNEAIELLPGGIGGSAPTYKPYPMFVNMAEGSKLWDVDGNEYIDFNLCWGVLLVGHKHPKLMKGLKEHMDYGTMP